MATGTYRGALESGNTGAAAQAQAAGLTIGPDGWWYDKSGKKLSHTDADKAVAAAGVAQDNAHQQWGTGGLIDRNRNFTGNLLKNVAPLAAFIPGVGPLAAAALSGAAGAAGSGLRHGTNFGDIAKQGVTSAAEGYGAGKGLQAYKGAGGGLAGLKAGAAGAFGAKNGPQGLQSVNNLLNPGGAPPGGAPNGSPGGGFNPLDFLTNNALPIAQGANAAYLGQKSSNFADMAAKNVDENWKFREPLRVQGLAGVLKPPVADTSALKRIGARGNPFADRPQPTGGY